ncbi:MAG: hypothetical protein KGZ39_03395 [Simkania sp.]|nr:hypothetical protein [Simkania sp.]
MSDIQGFGSGPISPQNRQLYEQDYKRGVDLFQRALGEYAKAEEPHKKEAFKQVMDNALHCLNESARGLKRQDLLQQTSKIEHDYQAYQSHAEDPEKTQLTSDLDQANKFIS